MNTNAAAIQEDVAITTDDPKAMAHPVAARNKIMQKMAKERVSEIDTVNRSHVPPPEGGQEGGEVEKKTVVVKVDGQESEMTQDELDRQVRAYQKHKAADIRLQEANARQAELNRQEALLREREARLARQEENRNQQTQQKTGSSLPAESQPKQMNLKDLASTLQESIFNEEPEKTAEVLQNILATVDHPRTPENDQVVARMVAQELQKQKDQEAAARQAEINQKRKEAQDKATRKFEQTYSKRIKADSKFWGRVNDQSGIVSKEHPEWDIWDIIEESVRVVDIAYKQDKGASQPSTTVIDDIDARMQRKQEMGNAVKPTGVSVPSSKKTGGGKQESDPFQQLKQARGQT